MAMTPRGWTINALATELERDQRTIAKKLAHVRPIEIRGRPWRIVVQGRNDSRRSIYQLGKP